MLLNYPGTFRISTDPSRVGDLQEPLPGKYKELKTRSWRWNDHHWDYFRSSPGKRRARLPGRQPGRKSKGKALIKIFSTRPPLKSLVFNLFLVGMRQTPLPMHNKRISPRSPLLLSQNKISTQFQKVKHWNFGAKAKLSEALFVL